MAAALRRRFGEEHFGLDGRLRDANRALLPEAVAWLAPGERSDDDGLRVPWSPRALLLNSFAAWRRDPGALRLADLQGFHRLAFDVRCPTGVRGTPPMVGLLASGPAGVVGVVASGIEAYARRPRALAPSYRRMAEAGRPRGWGRVIREGHFRHVDCGVLYRVALALRFTFPDHDCRVLYLHLEPTDADGLQPCHEHRRELRRLESALSGAEVGFAHASFNTLWQAWRRAGRPHFAAGLADRLLARYAVAVAGRSAPPLAEGGGAP